jgi:hypothetical protein
VSVGSFPIFTAGALVRCRASFTNRDLTDYELQQFQLSGSLPSGTGQDPPSVQCTAKRPDGSEVGVNCVRLAAGSWYADVDTTGFKGLWHVRIWSPAGQPNQGAGEAKFLTELDV